MAKTATKLQSYRQGVYRWNPGPGRAPGLIRLRCDWYMYNTYTFLHFFIICLFNWIYLFWINTEVLWQFNNHFYCHSHCQRQRTWNGELRTPWLLSKHIIASMFTNERVGIEVGMILNFILNCAGMAELVDAGIGRRYCSQRT